MHMAKLAISIARLEKKKMQVELRDMKRIAQCIPTRLSELTG